VKAYIRKANIQIAMKRYGEALKQLEKAKEHDEQKVHVSEIHELELKCMTGMGSMSEAEVAENARKDPEVMEILSDPVMRSILEQMQNDPRAAAEYPSFFFFFPFSFFFLFLFGSTWSAF